MKWPRGKYNGRRIVGIRVILALNVHKWHWKPYIGHYCGAIHWFCFLSWWEWEFSWKD